jgi:hypothetical protein
MIKVHQNSHLDSPHSNSRLILKNFEKENLTEENCYLKEKQFFREGSFSETVFECTDFAGVNRLYGVKT